MKKCHCLFSMTALVAALVYAGAAQAASDCLQLQLSSPASLCVGQAASIGATVTNSCPSRERVSAQVTLDGKAVPVAGGFSIAGDATLSKTFSFPVPATAAQGTHSITVTLTDAAGDTASASVDVTVSSCSTN